MYAGMEDEMAKTIEVNGTRREVVNAFSCGPGEVPHAYELKGGDYVYNVGRDWKLQARGQFAIVVKVNPFVAQVSA